MTANEEPAPGEMTPYPAPRPKKSTKHRDAAQAAINRSAKPVPLSTFFSGFNADTRGNIEVELDYNIAERYVSSMIPEIENHPNLNFTFPGEDEPTPTAIRHFGAGMNLAIGLKLLQSSPKSELSDTRMFRDLVDHTVHVPTSFIEILNLLGKTDHYDATIRVRDNPQRIRYHFLKAIWLALKTQSFQATPGYLVDYLDNLLRLSEVAATDLHLILFDDTSTLRALKREGRKILEQRLRTSITRTVHFDQMSPGVVCKICPPYLKANPTTEEFLDWIDSVHPAFLESDLTSLATIEVFRAHWLEKLDTPMSVLDAAYVDTPFAAITPRTILHSVGVRYYKQYFPSRLDFINTLIQVFDWYNSQSYNLSSMCNMRETSKTSFGNAAQLVMVDKDHQTDFKHFYQQTMITPAGALDHYLQFKIPVLTANKSHCCKKLATPGPILLAQMAMITKSVYQKENYVGFTTRPLSSMFGDLVRKAFTMKK